MPLLITATLPTETGQALHQIPAAQAPTRCCDEGGGHHLGADGSCERTPVPVSLRSSELGRASGRSRTVTTTTEERLKPTGVKGLPSSGLMPVLVQQPGHLFPYPSQIGAQPCQHLRGYAVALPDAAEHGELGANVVVTESAGFLQRQAPVASST